MAAELYIDGKLRQWFVGSLQWDANVGERARMGFTLVDEDEILDIQKGMQVYFYTNGKADCDSLLFGGLIEQFTETAITPISSTTGLYYNIEAVDWNTYLDRRIATGGFENHTAGEIVNDLAYEFLANENIYTHPYPGYLITVSGANLVGYWRLASDITDSSWKENSGSEFGSLTFTAENARVPADFIVTGSSPINDTETGGHVDIDTAGTDYVVTGLTSHEIEQNITEYETDGYTVIFFAYDDGAETGERTAVSAANSATLTGTPDNMFSARLESDANGGKMTFYVYDDSKNPVTVEETTALGTATWTMYVGVADGVNNEVRLYKDGNLEDTAALATGPRIFLDSSKTVEIGAVANGNDIWQGRMSEVAVIGRPLTTDEVECIYAQVGETNRTTDGSTLEEVNINYVTVANAIENIAEIQNYENNVDQFRTLHFHPRGAACCIAPFDLENSTVLASGLNRKNNNQKYRNRQIIKGGRDQTAGQTEVFDISGTNVESVTVGFPVALEPTVNIDSGGGDVLQTMGLKGIDDDDTGVDLLWAKGDEVITKRDGAFSNGDVITVEYTGEYNVLITTTDQAEVEGRRTVEKAGSGIVDAIVVDRGINKRSQGFEIAAGKLDTFARVGNELNFTTRTAGLRPGQSININIPRHSFINETGFIEQISLFDEAGIELRYSGKAVTGAVLKSWEQFFAKSQQEPEAPEDRVNIGEQTVTTVLVQNPQTITITPTGTAPTPVTCATLSATMPFTLC